MVMEDEIHTSPKKLYASDKKEQTQQVSDV